jgi:hypothetical protein
MPATEDLIPHPQVVQERLGYLYREARHLRGLLRIAIRRAEERQRFGAQPSQEPRQQSAGWDRPSTNGRN